MKKGKLSWELLKTIVTKSGSEAIGVIQGLKAGCDVAVFDFHEAKKTTQEFYNSHEEVLVVYKTDPITFPTLDPRRYAVIVNQINILWKNQFFLSINKSEVLKSEKEL